jgi:ElaB/YqjD/DUF883 family membrane-anchored ribosome-binding protein
MDLTKPFPKTPLHKIIQDPHFIPKHLRFGTEASVGGLNARLSTDKLRALKDKNSGEPDVSLFQDIQRRREPENETKKQIMNTNSATADKLAADLKTVANDAEELLSELTDDASDKAQAARERLIAAIQDAKRTCDRLQDKAREGLQATDETIRSHPYQSIGIAAGVGVLIGFLLGRK